MRTSNDFVPKAEVPRLVCEEIGGCVNPFDGKTVEAHGRDDPFSVTTVPWQFNLQKPSAFVIERQLALLGGDP